ncbi:acyl-CoA N-acyltransferase [Podospora didyma]|uniref:Acyl-CoA N-acyltransferase n=1 Tax=Podospora didyma TaxID=330526 RepID=A0AAE0U499_9PEZI|nr:acyl-CoA N-acyltransferase [Podospora didyma]
MASAFAIVPARHSDIPIIAAISSESFDGDSNTEMKSHGKSPFIMKDYMLSSLPNTLENPKIRVIKAVEEGTGAIIGFCTWGFRGIQPPPFPDLGPREEKPPPPPASQSDNPETEKSDDDDPIARLEKLTSGDFDDWMKPLMREGNKCLFIVGLSVAPAFQRRGVGSALLKWGTDLVDAAGGDAFAWVHSSQGACGAYQKAGFKTVRTLDVDLDEYAPVPAPTERYEGGKWGHYVFQYMIYGTPPAAGEEV